MTPSELAAAITDAVRDAVGAGDLDVPVPEKVLVERPRNREHGDYATNVALQLARPAGRPPRAGGGAAIARRLGACRRRGEGGGGRSRLPQHHPGGRGAGRAGLRDRRAPGDGYGRGDARSPGSGSTWSSSPPTRPARSTSAGRAGPRSATRSPGCCGPRAPTSRASTTSTTPARRSTGSPASLLRGRQGRADAGGRLRRRVHRRHRRRGRWPGTPDADSTCRTTHAVEVFRRDGVELMFAEIKDSLARFGVALRRLLHRDATCTRPEPGRRPRPAARAGHDLRGRRRGVAAHHRLRRRQGPGAGQARRRAGPTSPRTAPTTWTSASGASTGS